MRRELFVLDPRWVSIDEVAYAAAWDNFVREAANCGFVGLDLEWSPNVRVAASWWRERANAWSNVTNETTPKKNTCLPGPVAIVQLSTFSYTFVIKFCHVVRIVSANWRDAFRAKSVVSFPLLTAVVDNLRTFLADPNVVKLGVGILDDSTKLQRDYPTFCLSPCVDLVPLARCLFPDDGNALRLRSLKDFAARFAGMTLEKNKLVQTSDWGGCLGALSPQQLRYAAGDSEASFDACVGMLVESRRIATRDGAHDADLTPDEQQAVRSAFESAVSLQAKPRERRVRESQAIHDVAEGGEGGDKVPHNNGEAQEVAGEN